MRARIGHGHIETFLAGEAQQLVLERRTHRNHRRPVRKRPQARSRRSEVGWSHQLLLADVGHEDDRFHSQETHSLRGSLMDEIGNDELKK